MPAFIFIHACNSPTGLLKALKGGQHQRPPTSPPRPHRLALIFFIASLPLLGSSGLAQSLAEAVDATNLVWTAGGFPLWHGQTYFTHDGIDAALTIAPPRHGETWLQTKVTGPGSLAFWYRTSSHPGTLELYVGGMLKAAYSAGGLWRSATCEIPPGKQALRWRYFNPGKPLPPMYLDEISYAPASGAPSLRHGPENQVVPAATPTTLSVDAWGEPPLSFQWLFNGVAVSGATNYFLTLTNVQFSHSGRYRVVVSNVLGSAKSTNATLTVLSSVINEQPKSQRVAVGQTATLLVQASSGVPIRYQWLLSGVLIPGATNAALTLADVQESQTGVYDVEVSNSYGLVISSNALLTVVPAINLTLAGHWAEGGGNSVHSLAVQPPYAYLACREGGLEIVDVSRPTSPTRVGGCGTCSDAFGVDVIGRYAYVSMFDGTLEIFDVSDPRNPVSLSRHYTSGYQSYIRVAGDCALFGNSGGLNVIDIADPTRPFGVGSYLGSGRSFFRGLCVDLPLVYVAQDNYGLTIVNISDPSNPIEVGRFHSSILTRVVDVQVLHPKAYLARAESGLEILDVGDPTVPILLGSFNTSGSVEGLHVAGRYAFLADETKGLKVIDAEDTATLARVGSYDTAGEALAVRVIGHQAFVADGTGGLTILKVDRGPKRQPRIFSQPRNQTVPAGRTVSFVPTVFGTLPMFYQWEFNGKAIPDATRYWVTVTNVHIPQTGAYRVVVSNEYGYARSEPAILELLSAPVISCRQTNAPTFDMQSPFTFSFSTQTNVAYTIQVAGTLNDTNWWPLRVLVGNGENKGVVDSERPTPERFYQIRSSPNPAAR
jgi:hypothetical protein